jgi:hypothetical protein
LQCRVVSLYQIAGEFEADDPPLFYGCYRHLASRGDCELRKQCATQFPALLKTASASQYNSFHDTFHALATDQEPEVRVIVAGQLHEVSVVAEVQLPISGIGCMS